MNAQIRPAAAPEQAQDRLLWHDARTERSGAGGLDLLPQLLAPGDVLVLNDAATIPGSLRAQTLHGQEFEVRLIVRDGPGEWTVALFGAGDWRTPTEHRPEPPPLAIGDQLVFPGPIRAELIAQCYGIARLVQLRFDAGPGVLSHTLFGRGRPVQYSYLARELEVAEVQTPYASAPWAVEMPSAGRPLSWRRLRALRHRGVEIASLTHAAGLSSIGDAELDRRLPLPEPYLIPQGTVALIQSAQARGRRVIAVGTTVVRALESAALGDEGLRAGGGLAELKIGPGHRLQMVDGILSGTHEPGTSHFSLLSAFAAEPVLWRLTKEAARLGHLGHEFGDTVLLLQS